MGCNDAMTDFFVGLHRFHHDYSRRGPAPQTNGDEGAHQFGRTERFKDGRDTAARRAVICRLVQAGTIVSRLPTREI
jgi:hypothetical protein